MVPVGAGTVGYCATNHLPVCLLTLPWRGRVDAKRRGGVISQPRHCLGMIDLHPTPSHISLRSCDPTLPLQGRVTTRIIQTSLHLPAARSARVVACSFRPLFRGRRECRAPGAPAAARGVVVSTRVSHHGHTGNARHSPRNGFTTYFVLSPVIGLFCHRRLADISARLERQRRDVRTTRLCRPLSRHSSKALSASTASRINVRDDREAPLL
jgi:hypothetical protein